DPDIAVGALARSFAAVAGAFGGRAGWFRVRQCPDTCTPPLVVYPETQIASLRLLVPTCSSLLAEDLSSRRSAEHNGFGTGKEITWVACLQQECFKQRVAIGYRCGLGECPYR